MTNEILAYVSARSIKGTSFVGVNNYVNSNGEKSNQLVLAGYSHEMALKEDLTSLLNYNPIGLYLKYNKDVVDTAYSELLASLRKRLADNEMKAFLLEQGDSTMIRSKAQNDAYITLGKGLKFNVTTKTLYIFGLVVKKTILESGIYKHVNSSDKTIVKSLIKKACNFKELKIREFKLEQGTFKSKGLTF